jgi:hypothetical protein
MDGMCKVLIRSREISDCIIKAALFSTVSRHNLDRQNLNRHIIWTVQISTVHILTVQIMTVQILTSNRSQQQSTETELSPLSSSTGISPGSPCAVCTESKTDICLHAEHTTQANQGIYQACRDATDSPKLRRISDIDKH